MTVTEDEIRAASARWPARRAPGGRALRLDHGCGYDPISVLSFTVVNGRMAALDLIVDLAKLRHPSLES